MSNKPTTGGPAKPGRSMARRAMMAAIWVVIGGGSLTYAGALVYANVVRLEVDSATIAGSVEPIRVPADGIMAGIDIHAGDKLAAGRQLASIRDPEVERQVSLSAIQLERARHQFNLRQAELTAERAKRDDTVLVAKSELKAVQSEIVSLEEQVATAQVRVERFTGLFVQGFAARHKLEDMTNQLATLKAQLSRARLLEEQRRSLITSAEAGRFFDGTRVTGRLAEIEAAAQRARAEVDVTTQELRVWQERRAASVVVASGSGRVMRVLQTNGSAVRAGDTLAVFERTGERFVHAFLTQSEVMKVAIGDTASVYIPALRLRASAQVSTIERAAGFLDDVESRYTWRQARDGGARQGDLDRTARVVLRFEGDDGERLRAAIEPGTPVVVSFQRRSTDTVLGDFRKLEYSLEKRL
ncbi:MAG: HlyD family efflux transporter periplasmic adaptor subunit [Rhodospirillales bacterium]|nr:HlyD family efflux transporter periplasmic adaptor subunit [Rhodospirillales bacterium]